jgi:hypothetical protein
MTELSHFLATRCSTLCLDDEDDRQRLVELLTIHGRLAPSPESVYHAILDSMEQTIKAHTSRGDITLAQMACLPVLRKLLDELARTSAQAVLSVLAHPDETGR